MPDLLYEIASEEIPAGYIAPALSYLYAAIQQELDAARLAYGGPDKVVTTGTPRRLVLAVADLSARQPDTEEDIAGPPVKAAFDADGNPTRAALGFARSQSVDVSKIEQRETERGTYCFVRKRVEGRAAAEILAEILPTITLGIAFPKSMLWPGSDRPFARPVRSLLALFGSEVIDFELFGLRTARTTEGHPILSPGRIEVRDADYRKFKELLRDRHVIVEVKEREQKIRNAIGRSKRKPDRFGIPVPDAGKALIPEVANLVQNPTVTFCRFDEAFLALPDAVIEAAMMEHQRYFPVQGPEGLRPHFIVVSDRGLEPASEDLIRTGNEEVLAARLADAQFFYQQDGKAKLADRVAGLSGVAFLKGLGTYAEKTARLEKLSRVVSEALGLDAEAADYAARAAHLCKADLITEMVGEFPKLQGEVGRIYALRDGEPEPVADAVAEHYLPRSADRALPTSPSGRALSLTEKIDNLASCFALGLIPTGSADPYALRRQAQAALRIIEQNKRHLNLTSLIRKARALLPEPHRDAEDTTDKLIGFLRQRIFVMAVDRGAPHDLINAALAPGFDDVVDFWLRLDALRTLSTDASWQPLVTAVERTFNISKDAPEDGTVDPALFAEPLEKELWSLVKSHQAEIVRLQDERRYVDASRKYAEVFAETLHQFFEDVFVNVDDENLRGNRLHLLRHINRLYSARIADLSEIVTGVKANAE